MAKMFYTLDETKASLGKSEEEIKQFTREGRLREFRDGARLMFRADQVESLKAQFSGGAAPRLDVNASDSGAPIGLVDSRGGSSIGIGLADSGAGAGSGLGSGLGSGVGSGMGSGLGSGLGSGIGTAGSGMMNLREDSALSADLGLSGSMGGVPSPARGSGGVGTGAGSGGSAGSRAGVNVFGEDEGHADPMAQTAISSPPIADLNLESVGSGSGLLDLTRESDDTSLGAELLDEISPGTGKRAATPPDSAAMKAGSGSATGLEAPRGGVNRGSTVSYYDAPDPWAGALGGAALGAAFVLLFGLLALTSSLYGVPDPASKWFADNHYNFGIIAAVMLGLPFICFVGGFLISKSTARR